ncbi:MAG: leucine-rich repeat protein [Clostridia bacterium]|nr:leucine-rich repeat protein [Clostridia bacterium]
MAETRTNSYYVINGENYFIYQEGDWKYLIIDGEDSLCEYTGSSTEISIPAQLGGRNVTAIYNKSKVIKDGITGLEIPATFLSVPSQLCYGKTSLQWVTIHEGVEAIGQSAFYGCSGLTSVTLPDTVTYIADFAFNLCTGITSLDLGDGLVTVGKQAFYNAQPSTLILPQTLKNIGYLAFYSEDTSLTEVDIPDGVETWEFSFVPAATTMVVGEDSAIYAALLNYPYSIRYRTRNSSELPEAGEGIENVADKVDAIVAACIQPGMSDEQKALVLHDYLTQHAQYDVTLNLPYTHDPDGVLLYNRGVCQSYAEAYQLLLNEVGIDNCLEYGENHVWNMACLDGDWVHIDVTWDDPTRYGQGTSLEPNARSGREGYTYFGLTTEAIEHVNQHECEDRPYPATSYRHSYLWKHGALDSRIAEVQGILETQLAAGVLNFTCQPETFDSSDNADGIREYLTLAVLRDQTYTVDEVDYEADFAYDLQTKTLTVTVCLPSVEIDHGTLLLAPGETLYLPLADAVWETTGCVTVDEDGLLTVTDTGTGQITGSASTEIHRWTIDSQEMDTLRIDSATVEEEAFMNTAAVRVVIGADVAELGDRAFAGCDALLLVRFEGSTVVGDDCFPDSGTLLILAPEGSPAEAYAQSEEILFYPVN